MGAPSSVAATFWNLASTQRHRALCAQKVIMDLSIIADGVADGRAVELDRHLLHDDFHPTPLRAARR